MATNFPGGVTNVNEAAALGSYLAPDPSIFHEWFDDFDSYVAGNWTVTETQAGATQAIIDGDGGLLALTNSAADDDVNQIQWSKETFRLASTKRTWIKARFKVSDATQSDLAIGLYITDTSPFASAPSDGFYFTKADGATALTFKCGKDSSYTTSGTVVTMANDTFVTVTAVLDPTTRKVHLFSGDTRVQSIALTNLCDDEDLAVSIAVQNGEAAAKTLTIDYLLVSKER